jgi:hypothetical protein
MEVETMSNNCENSAVAVLNLKKLATALAF